MHQPACEERKVCILDGKLTFHFSFLFDYNTSKYNNTFHNANLQHRNQSNLMNENWAYSTAIWIDLLTQNARELY